MNTVATTTAADVAAVLSRCPPSVKDVYAIVRDLGGLWPRQIHAELERRRGDFVGVSTVDHALAVLKRLGLARSTDGWRACEGEPDPRLDRNGRQRDRARFVRRWRLLARAVEQLRAEARDASQRGALTEAEVQAAEGALEGIAAELSDEPPMLLPRDG